MSGVVYSIRFNVDNPDEARIIEAIEHARAAHGRAGVRRIAVEAFKALLDGHGDVRRMLDRQDEILRTLDQLRRSGVAIGEPGEQALDIGELDPEFSANLLGAFKPGVKR